jgi:hypothetical protein
MHRRAGRPACLALGERSPGSRVIHALAGLASAGAVRGRIHAPARLYALGAATRPGPPERRVSRLAGLALRPGPVPKACEGRQREVGRAREAKSLGEQSSGLRGPATPKHCPARRVTVGGRGVRVACPAGGGHSSAAGGETQPQAARVGWARPKPPPQHRANVNSTWADLGAGRRAERLGHFPRPCPFPASRRRAESTAQGLFRSCIVVNWPGHPAAFALSPRRG